MKPQHNATDDGQMVKSKEDNSAVVLRRKKTVTCIVCAWGSVIVVPTWAMNE